MKSQLIAQCNSWRIMTPCFHCAILYTTGHEISRGKRSCQVGSLAPFQLSHPHHRLNKWIHSRSFIAAETTEFPTAAPTITPLENARGGRVFLRHGTECDLSTGSLCVTVFCFGRLTWAEVCQGDEVWSWHQAEWPASIHTPTAATGNGSGQLRTSHLVTLPVWDAFLQHSILLRVQIRRAGLRWHASVGHSLPDPSWPVHQLS